MYILKEFNNKKKYAVNSQRPIIADLYWSKTFSCDIGNFGDIGTEIFLFK